MSIDDIQGVIRLLVLAGLSAAMLACSDSSQQKSQQGNTVNEEKRDKVEHAVGLTAASHTESDASGWPTYGGQSTGTQYSSLEQINLNNIDRLEVVWTYHTGDVSAASSDSHATNYQVTPILANNKLYLCTPFNNIIALNPETGEEDWRFDFNKPLTETMYGYHNCRGVSYWQARTQQERDGICGKRIFEGTDNGYLLAVDADTGKLCHGFGVSGKIDLNKLDYKGDGRITSTSPPAIYQDVVIIGGTVIDNKWKDSLDGIVRGFDARTGEQLWSWNPIPESISQQVGGANTWAPMSVDEERGWVFLPTGSPSYDTYGANRKEAVPFANAVVVLDALTGNRVWSYQTVHHDLWDYDLASMPTLAYIQHDGKNTPAVLQATKMGYVFVLDRLTGEPLFPVEQREVPQTDIPGEYSSPTQPVPLLPAPVSSQNLRAEDAWGAAFVDKKECQAKLAALRNEGLYTPPSIKGSILHPSFLGGTNWGGIAYDQDSGLAVLNSSSLVSSVTLMPRDQYDPEKHKKPGVAVYEMRESPYIMLREVLFSSLGAPCNPPPWGSLTAIDMNTGETRWQVPFGRVEFAGPIKSLASWGAPNQGGPIITKAGLVFIGASLDSKFRAYNLYTGEQVWSSDVPAPATATPMTYTYGEKESRQYIVVAAGGHGGFQTKISDAIVAFALKP